MILAHFPLSTVAQVIAAVGLFTILAIVYCRAFSDMPLGSGRSGWGRLPLALAASLLSVLGMFGMGGAQADGGSANWLPVVLMPYEALGVTLLLLPLVVSLAGAWGRRGRVCCRPRTKCAADRSTDGGKLQKPAKLRTNGKQ